SKDIPLLYLSNLSNNTINTIPASYASWLYKREDGCYNHLSVQNSNQPSNTVPLLSRIEISTLNKQIKIRFSLTPNSFTVQCWPEALSGFRKTYYNDSKQYLDIVDNTISLPIEEPSYIVQINGAWDQGEVKYAFSITELIDDI
ncbi:MAG: hypothetical protein K0S61_2446, partial [Anaerocolumna sp.]|nr:hypothetical protein [Anaerocolumna sp.]